MLTEIIMPKAGADMEEGQIIKWHKKEGDDVKAGELLLEIMTDKVSMEIEAEASGKLLKIYYGDDAIVPVITTIGYIGDESDVVPENPNASSQEKNETPKEEVKEVKEEKKEKPQETKKELSENEYDFVVIGAGPGGYYAAIKAAQLGAKVAIFEKEAFGGTCLNRGCIPTKTYLENAKDLKKAESFKKRGIVGSKATIELDKALKNKNTIVKKLSSGVEFLLKSNGVKIVNEEAVIVDSNKVKSKSEELIANNIIFAGGSKCIKNIKGSENNTKVIDTDEALNLSTAPKDITIVGAGFIGLEFAQIFNSLGTKVTVIEKNKKSISEVDSEIFDMLISSLSKDKINFIFEKEVTEIKENEVFANEESISKSELILLTTRTTDLSALKEFSLDLENDNVKADNLLKTSKNIYAVGDVNGKFPLAHAAFKMSEVAVKNGLNIETREFKKEHIPFSIYTYPEVASVGLTEEQASKQYDIEIGKFNLSANGRAMSFGDSAGLIKIISDKRFGEILGAHIISPNASEIINEISVLMQAEITVDEVIKMVFGHPTFSEAISEAVSDTKGLSVHGPKKK